MLDQTRDDGLADFDYPSGQLLLEVTFLREVASTIQFRLHRHLILLFAGSVALSFFGPAVLQSRGAELSWILACFAAAGCMTAWSVAASQTMYRRAARPCYVYAALRSLPARRRRSFLDKLNTVSLRGERIPFTQSDVLSAVQSCGGRLHERTLALDARNCQAARLQAGLIDVFRGQ